MSIIAVYYFSCGLDQNSAKIRWEYGVNCYNFSQAKNVVRADVGFRTVGSSWACDRIGMVQVESGCFGSAYRLRRY
jgi:hypothetical protein